MKLNRNMIKNGNYTVLTDITNEDLMDAIENETYEFLFDVWMNQVENILSENGFEYYGRSYLGHFANNRDDKQFTTGDYICELIQFLALKEGADLVKFENGRLGFVGYYGNYISAFELIKIKK